MDLSMNGSICQRYVLNNSHASNVHTATGFRWWPIKAYRPCGKAAQAGIEYSRKGQGVDEVMFGRK